LSSADSGGAEPQAESQAEEQQPAEAAEAAEAAEPEAPAVDEQRQPLLDTLRAELGDSVVGAEIAGGDIWVRVERSAWLKAAEVCKNKLRMAQFCFLSGMDWLPNNDLSAEKVWDPEAVAETNGATDTATATTYETGVAGGDTRFQVFARVFDPSTSVGITLKADLDENDPRVASWISVYRGADWHEREAWEMYGFTFDGHPDLRHIYLPAEFEGHPLRKDFPLLAREVKPWPGLVDKEPIPGEDEEEEPAAAEGGDGG
jgi:NADH-quinone oxidoreductase subunit C